MAESKKEEEENVIEREVKMTTLEGGNGEVKAIERVERDVSIVESNETDGMLVMKTRTEDDSVTLTSSGLRHTHRVKELISFYQTTPLKLSPTSRIDFTHLLELLSERISSQADQKLMVKLDPSADLTENNIESVVPDPGENIDPNQKYTVTLKQLKNYQGKKLKVELYPGSILTNNTPPPKTLNLLSW